MFTGLVEHKGRLRAVKPEGASKRFSIEVPFASELEMGESVCTQGACLSVVELGRDVFSVTAVAETLRRTSLGGMRVGQKVNLERSLRLSDRLGGHMVTGHVDATGRVDSTRAGAAERILKISFPADYSPLVVEKGSIAIDGVSLTVVEAGAQHVTVALIPQTCDLTTLGDVHVGDKVNLEFDLVAKYLLRFRQLGIEQGEWKGGESFHVS
jgi:riboflavin synthase